MPSNPGCLMPRATVLKVDCLPVSRELLQAQVAGPPVSASVGLEWCRRVPSSQKSPGGAVLLDGGFHLGTAHSMTSKGT